MATNHARQSHLLALFKYGLEHGQFPSRLFKYTTIGNLELMLENSTLKFSTISEFNDKRECFALLDFDCSRDEWIRYIIGVNPGITIPQIASMIQRLARNPDLGRQWITTAIKDTNKNLGILCLTVSNNNNLMWAHYADNHRGVCLEFAPALDLKTFCFPKKVIYDDKVNRINYIKSWNLRKGMDVTETIFHKSSEWSYEQEHRVVRINCAGIIPFNIKALRSIGFGTDTSDDTVLRIKDICFRKGYRHITFTQRTLDENTGHFVIKNI